MKWREWIKMMLKKKEKLGQTEADKELILNNIPLFCQISDEMIRSEAGDDANINKIFDELPEEQKVDLSRDVIKEGLARLKKKKKKPEEQESETESSMIQREAESKIEEKNVSQGS